VTTKEIKFASSFAKEDLEQGWDSCSKGYGIGYP